MDSPWKSVSCLKIMKVRFAGCLRLLICIAVAGLGAPLSRFLEGAPYKFFNVCIHVYSDEQLHIICMHVYSAQHFLEKCSSYHNQNGVETVKVEKFIGRQVMLRQKEEPPLADWFNSE